MLANLQWPTLEERRKNTRVSLLKKILEEKVAIRCEYLKPARTRARHDNQQLEEQFSRTEYRKMSLIRLNKKLSHLFMSLYHRLSPMIVSFVF